MFVLLFLHMLFVFLFLLFFVILSDAVWNLPEVSTAIGRDLVGKAERWKILAG